MIEPIRSSNASFPTPENQTPQERQKLFELQFDTAVISEYVAVTQKNSPLQPQIAKLKNGLASGRSPDALAGDLNHLIDQVNQTIVPGKPKFPSFQFTSEGSQATALSNYAHTLQKFVMAAGEHGMIAPEQKQQLCADLNYLGTNTGGMTPIQAYESLNQVIDRLRTMIPSMSIPNLPYR